MRRGASLLVVAAVLLAGCSDPPESKLDRPGTVPSGSSYVALGDSYSAGPRLGPSTGAVGCEQTKGNYPHLLADRLGLDLTDVTCGGATSTDLTESQTPPNGSPVPPQLDALSSSTDLVTIGMGGNDGKVFSELVTTCVGKAAKDRGGAPCTAEGASFRVRAERQIGKLPTRMVEAIEAVRERAPEATIIVVGYPAIFPEDGTCPLLPLARGDYPYARELVSRINDGLAAAADQAGVEYVDVWDATDGHDICATDPWIAGIIPAHSGLEYHPYAEEQAVVADLLVAALR
ncbi:SGNH/GDSL hydrolase family protein [Nocardioides kongjuensis]|uniref:Lysophospholipase L1-like esterase n=1 Tax=Nocardioides kongjuensis TaxID=349522 RepID=A0A852RR83_9ACTN|nr:SGNH/GDSL hydrolase family protein [Nocardioides kongjuensis]NYD31756.1 lysophospholipase L1-like esterase [Nocardioides kongjuensis]